MAASCSTIVLVGQMEARKMAVFCCYTSSVGHFWVAFHKGEALQQCILVGICSWCLEEPIGIGYVASGGVGWLDEGLQVIGFLCTFLFCCSDENLLSSLPEMTSCYSSVSHMGFVSNCEEDPVKVVS